MNKYIVVSLVGILSCLPFYNQAQPQFLNKSNHKFTVIAHRGDHTNAPENTLLAYQHAIDNDVDFVEIDLRTTVDGKQIIMHNSDIEHMTSIKGKVKEMRFDSLRKIMVKDPTHLEWGIHKIPTFNEVLELCKGKINIYLDFKDADVEKTYQAILAAHMEKNIMVYINAPSQYTEWRKIAPEMPLVISLPKKVNTDKQMKKMILRYKMEILDGDFSEYTAQAVITAQENHILVWPDIQSADEGPERWDKAFALGFDGLQTDHPAALIKYLISKGIR
jgi:glycerophosphoryl diester phosphodiesterase